MCTDAKSVTWPWTCERCVTRCSYPSPECLRAAFLTATDASENKERREKYRCKNGRDLSRVIHKKNHVMKAPKTLTHETRWHWNFEKLLWLILTPNPHSIFLLRSVQRWTKLGRERAIMDEKCSVPVPPCIPRSMPAVSSQFPLPSPNFSKHLEAHNPATATQV